jgi:hypothetical protein
MIYHLESARRFPCRVRIGARAVGWVESEVQMWLADRVERYRAEPESGNQIPRPSWAGCANTRLSRSSVDEPL